MAQLRRLAILAEDPSRLAGFYRAVFDLEQIAIEAGAVFLSDGVFNLAFLPAGQGAVRGLNYLGFQKAAVESIQRKLQETDNAHSLQSSASPGMEYLTQDPDGNRVGFSSRAFATSSTGGPAPIRHLALYTPDPARLSDFYCRVFGMKEVQRSDRSSIFVSDGYFNLALLYQRSEERLGLNHFGFYVRSNEEMRDRAEKAGVAPGARRPARIPFAEYRVHDPEGNGFDISEKGWKI